MKSALFVARLAVFWGIAAAIIVTVAYEGFGLPDPLPPLAFMAALTFIFLQAFTHVRRVRLISDRVDTEVLGSRHLRQVEVPLPADEAFDLVDATIRELPNVETVESTRDSLQVFARVRAKKPYSGHGVDSRRLRRRRNLVHATITPGDQTSTVRLVCEPEGGSWMDWFLVDYGTNLENADAVTRAVTRRISERRRAEAADTRETATQKELAVAKLSLLHAQVEPHFLYNTLASAQVLTRSDPAKADLMLGHLITYLRHSLPKTDETTSTLGEELERARSYLEILKIRMGERLDFRFEVPDGLHGVPMPAMMLQTLVENAIKHGLEPAIGGGTVWVVARENEGKVAVTVADDGLGLGGNGSGTGIGLRNVRERLRLAYGDAASLTIASNFPRGVAATLQVPRP